MRAWLCLTIICIGSLPTAGTRGQTASTDPQISELVSIHPIEAKAEDVRKLLGEPLSKSPDFYRLEGFNVQATFGGGSPCDLTCERERQYCGWNVPKGTLLTLAIIVKRDFHRQDLVKLGLDLNKFSRVENADHIPGVTQYSCAEQGIGIIINGNQVESISLYPAKKYLHLMCSQREEVQPASISRKVQRPVVVRGEVNRHCGQSSDQARQLGQQGQSRYSKWMG
jgi:hypothetical protein